ncbi:PXMP2/4 family protein 4 [Bienertia sinuspersici]
MIQGTRYDSKRGTETGTGNATLGFRSANRVAIGSRLFRERERATQIADRGYVPRIPYMDLLAKSPVLTKAVTSALLTLVGDLICQLVIDKVPSLDFKRTSIFTFLGLAFVGPTLHYWYLYLSKVVTLQGASGAFVRLLLDQMDGYVTIAVCLCTCIYWNFSLYIDHIGRKAFTSYPKASAGCGNLYSFLII